MSLPYFFLQLDTTEPKINLYAPNYANRITTEIIRIESNENLSDWQNIYVIDSQKNRHKLTFTRVSERELVGELTFSGFPYGIAILCAQVQDEVGNLSRIAMANINVLPVYDTYEFGLNLNEYTRDLSLFEWEALKNPPNGGNTVTGAREQQFNMLLSETDVTTDKLNLEMIDKERVTMTTNEKLLINVDIYDSEE